MIRRVSQYSRNSTIFNPLGPTTVNPGQTINIYLPSNDLNDARTVKLLFLATVTCNTSGATAALPTDIETLIRAIQIVRNGEVISEIQDYNHLWKLYCDFQVNTTDAIGRRQFLQNSAPYTNLTSPQTQIYCTIANFLGFLGTCSTPIIDTRLYGNVMLRITLAGNEVLALSAPGVSATWQITNLQMTVDTISISDGIFYNSVDSYLAKGGVFEVAFQDWLSFPSTTTSWSSTANFQANGGSINAVVAFWTNANADQKIPMLTRMIKTVQPITVEF
jgi:hypothetical protein